MPGVTAVTASREYNPGDLIYSEEAFVWALRPEGIENECECCFKRSDNLITCNNCSAVKYCGVECQEKDANNHKVECANLKKMKEEDIQNTFLRIAGRVILKIKGKDWKSITTTVMGREVSFDDLKSNYEELIKSPTFLLFCEYLKESLKTFIGEENIPVEEEFIKIVAKLKYSAASLSDSGPEIFCLGLTSFDNECIPNAHLQSCNNVLKIHAIKKIEVSERITVSPRCFLNKELVRSPITADCPEVCKCTECSLPYGESVLTKVLDDKKAFSVIEKSENFLNMASVLSDIDVKIIKDNLVEMGTEILKEQEGILADTNALHMKVLAEVSKFMAQDDPQKHRYILDLEKKMSAVFGEYSPELDPIYKALLYVSQQNGNQMGTLYYLSKLQRNKLRSLGIDDEVEVTEDSYIIKVLI